MGRFYRSLPVVAGLLPLLGVPAFGQEAATPEPSGEELFFTYCGACHGTGGEGDGLVVAELEYVPPDLTTIARRNGGSFPRDRVFRIVDGRDPIEGHGGPDMPRWNDVFRTPEDGFDEARAEHTIELIVEHIASIQKED